jgi:hypothetical protein
LINCQIFGNTAYYGSGIYNDAENGGDATLTLVNSQVFGNKADIHGGGIYNDGRNTQDTAILTLTNSKIFGNTAANGGGIYNDGSQGGTAIATITNSQIYGNKATATSSPVPCIGGGGIYNDDRNVGTATVTLTGSQISGNTGYYGGGIKNTEGTLNVYSSLVTGNTAIKDGGGIFWNVNAPTIAGSLIYGNTPNNIAHA